jgi:TonB-linked SusC/RagA family outer membrane protein
MKFYTCFSHAYFKKREKQNKQRPLWPRLTEKSFHKLKQTAMRINLILFLIAIAMFKVTASVKAQSINLSFENAQIEKVFTAIEKQSNYIFWYDKALVKSAKKVSIKINNGSLKETLDQCFKDQTLEYQIVDNTIVVKEKPKINTVQPNNLKKSIPVRGKVSDSKKSPLSGVSIKIKGTSLGTVTDDKGNFSVEAPDESSILVVSYLGFQTVEFVIKGNTNPTIELNELASNLETVSIVNTGYQQVPKERATGSFVQIDNVLLSRSVSTSILDRLANVTSGLVFNSNTASSNRGQYDINIRGRGTIYANDQPLIVVDNFPYEGDMNTINPNDIESITILKDAAAASIWGARSGNGVIVINTKRGKLNKPLKVSINSNFNIGDKPDMYYNPNFLSSSDFIDVEQMLFQKGFYAADEASFSKTVLSPVVELLIKKRDGKIPAAEADAMIHELRKNDIRRDFDQYIYRKSVNQQYSLNLTGGSEKVTYNFSAGYDNNLDNLKRNSYDRLTLNSYNTFNPVKNLELSAAMNFVHTNTDLNNSGWGYNPKLSTITPATNKNIFPYAKLAEENGNALPLFKFFRAAYIDTLAKGKLLDWNYRPLEELGLANNTIRLNDIRLNTGARYSFTKTLNADVKYQLQKSISKNANLNSIQSYFARNLINQYTLPATPDYTKKILLGDILDQSFNDISSYSLRGQVNYDETFSGKHQIAAMVGAEVREVQNITNLYRLYGYDPEHTLAGKVDYATNVNKVFPYASNNQAIPNIDANTELLDRYRSFYANASYNFDSRYIISGSLRKDASNLFGVKTNQRAVPLWSSGVSWNLSNEHFYNLAWLPTLKFRATYGYNGNINKSVTAYTTAVFSRSSATGLTNASITSPANDDLRWERVRIFNLGLDFAFKKQRLSGSIEYYSKRGLDLFGDAILAPATGITSFKANLSDSKGNGIDILLNSQYSIGPVSWSGSLLFSRATDKVVNLKSNLGSANYVSYSDGVSQTQSLAPREGYPVYSVFSYRWAGLDANGDPQGYINNEVSKDYSAIRSGTQAQDLVYHGSARPTTFGSFRNDFRFGPMSLSVNISYKLGYYFRRSSISYSDLFSNWIGHKDYYDRWKQPGDELLTDVPALQYPDVNERSFFYTYSSVLVEKGDHIRLQDIALSYDLTKARLKSLPVHAVKFFTYVNNIGFLWRANKRRLDPDAATFPAPRTYALGMRVDF